MTMLLEQNPARPALGQAPSHRERDADHAGEVSRRALVWAHTDIFSNTEVSPARQAAAWIALTVCLAVLVLLALGF
jgi:hypothetical protein